MDRSFTLLLRAAIVVALLLGLFGQFVVIPGVAAAEVARFPPYERIAAPYVTVAVLGVLCVQIALVAVWMLLGMLRSDTLFDHRAFARVDVIIGSALVATLLAAGVTVHLALTDMPFPNGAMDAVGALGGAFLGTATGACCTMLLVLMRGLLRKATDLRTEMSEVI
ncbi:DUF2975 domain-containing protein [Nocardiopsis sp. MG754419]|uniref:DUF2975 domain-containing protein n=1 Tax=Nocardiopsis sp. MG754419 TaxID=2259865 RepID=UPI001BAB1481|nr:DUF2975 domain-containing protein [Nocardiopsis sp. MG754419]MBR8743045.1 DUF2975 domain-containing protein [Nocardiopsis sp. MG754419]